MIKNEAIVKRYFDFLKDLKKGKVTISYLLRKHKIHSHIYDSLKNMGLVKKDNSHRYFYVGEEPTMELARRLKNNLNSTITHKYKNKYSKINPEKIRTNIDKLSLVKELQSLVKKENEIKIEINKIIKQLNETI